jgi:hypothetical protein
MAFFQAKSLLEVPKRGRSVMAFFEAINMLKSIGR